MIKTKNFLRPLGVLAPFFLVVLSACQTSPSVGGPTNRKPPIIIGDSNNENSVAADNQDVEISGSAKDVAITGLCNNLTVRGRGSNVRVDSVSSILVTGSENKIKWIKAANGPVCITDQGRHNYITHPGN